MTPLSEQLAELSKRAADVESRVEAFKKDAEDMREAKVAKLKADVESAQNRFESSVAAKKDEVTSAWAEFNTNMKARADKVKAEIEAKKEVIDKGRAERRAGRLEDNAAASIAFALLAMEDAEYAVAEAVDARLHAQSFE